MKAEINLITILANDVRKMTAFYQDVLGFEVLEESPNYVEFKNDGARFSICTREVMAEITGHHSFHEETKGQTFELAFPCNNPQDVEESYHAIIEKGGIPIKEPAQMPWGQTTAFFADPEGNIHEIFC